MSEIKVMCAVVPNRVCPPTCGHHEFLRIIQTENQLIIDNLGPYVIEEGEAEDTVFQSNAVPDGIDTSIAIASSIRGNGMRDCPYVKGIDLHRIEVREG